MSTFKAYLFGIWMVAHIALATIIIPWAINYHDRPDLWIIGSVAMYMMAVQGIATEVKRKKRDTPACKKETNSIG